MKSLDKFDLKLIVELENNSRQTLSKIGKTLGTSQQVISYRIQTLLKNKIIGGFYTVINFTKLGYTSYRTMIRLTNMTEDKRKEFIQFVKSKENVLWVVECGGRWDIILNFLGKNIIHYYLFIRSLLHEFPDLIQSYDVLTTLKVIYFGRDYFMQKYRKIETKTFFGGDDYQSVILDDLDLKILDLISTDARLSSVEVAKKIKSSPNTVIYRIKNLTNMGIIQGFKPIIHAENTNRSVYKALIKYNTISNEREEELIRYLQNYICVVAVVKLIGYWDFEVEFEVENKEEMLHLIRKLREDFKDVIKEFENIPLYKEFGYNFFPKDLLTKNKLTNPDK